jgi:hypothetical protein
MRLLLLIFFCIGSISVFSQELDSTKKVKRKRIALTKYPRPQPPPEKKAYAVITSDMDSSLKDPWEREWNAYIEEQSRIIAGKVLLRDSSRAIYKVMIDFSVKEDGTLKDLKVNCNPSNEFVIKECTKMVLNAPKKRSQYRPGQYVKMQVKQPVDIKVK